MAHSELWAGEGYSESKPHQNSNFTNDIVQNTEIFNNQQTSQGVFWTYRRPCEFCFREHKDNCDFEFEDPKITLKEMARTIKNRDLHLVVLWRQSPQANMALIEKPRVLKID